MTPAPHDHDAADPGTEVQNSPFGEELDEFRAQIRKDFATQTRVLTGYITFLGLALLIVARLTF